MIEFKDMTEAQQDQWYLAQAVERLDMVINDVTEEQRNLLLSAMDYLWYLKK